MSILDSIKKAADVASKVTDVAEKAKNIMSSAAPNTAFTNSASPNAAPLNAAAAKAAALVGSKTAPSTNTAPLNSAAAAKAAALVGSMAAPKELSSSEVLAIVENKVREKGRPSNWQVSIVDLMTALDMNSSLASRKELAAKLNYPGYDTDGSAEKNMWLHAELLKALAQNGGEVPSYLLG
jgi:hypothetical protein